MRDNKIEEREEKNVVNIQQQTHFARTNTLGNLTLFVEHVEHSKLLGIKDHSDKTSAAISIPNLKQHFRFSFTWLKHVDHH